MTATYTKGSSGDTWAFTGNMTVGGTQVVTGALSAATLTINSGQVVTGATSMGTVADAGGVALTDAAQRGFGLFTELLAAGSALTAGTVARGIESRLVINKDQTTNADVSIYALEGHLRVKQDLPSSSCFGIWAYFEQSGTVAAGSIVGGLRSKVEGDAGLTAGAVFGILVDGHIASGATVTDFPAIKVATDIEGTTGQKAWTSILKVGTAPSSAYFVFPDDGTMAKSTAASPLSDAKDQSTAGFIKVMIGSTAKYIALYDAN